jgi:hypothetical protein
MCVIQIFAKGSREFLSCGLFGNIMLLILQICEVRINMQPQPTKDGPAEWGLGVGHSSSLQESALLSMLHTYIYKYTNIHNFYSVKYCKALCFICHLYFAKNGAEIAKCSYQTAGSLAGV